MRLPPELRSDPAWVSSRIHPLPGPAQPAGQETTAWPSPQPQLPPIFLHSVRAKGDARPLSPFPCAPRPQPTPAPRGDLSGAGFQRGAGGEKDQQKGPEKCGLWGRVVTTSWHPRALLGGGFWAALTNSLPRRVPRTPAEPALAFPPLTSTAVAASPRQPASGLPSKGVPGLGGGGGALQAQVQARPGKRKATWTGEGSQPGQARAGGGWDGGGSRGSGILPSQDPRG